MPTLTPRRVSVVRIPRQPKRWSPKTDLSKTAPAVEVDLRRGYAFGIACGAFASMVGGLVAALYFLGRGDEQDVDVSLAVASVAFVTTLVAGHIHQRGLR